MLLSVAAIAGAAEAPLPVANECPGNVEQVTLNSILYGPPLVATLGNNTCVDLAINFFQGTNLSWVPAANGLAWSTNNGNAFVVLFNANNGVNGNQAANICVWFGAGANMCMPPGMTMVQAGQSIDTGPQQLTDGDFLEVNSVVAGGNDTVTLTPTTPEPGTFGLMATGLPGIAWWARRRNRLRGI